MFIAVGALLAALTPATAHAAAGADSCADSQATIDQVGLARMSAATLCLLRAERVARDVGPVRGDGDLVKVARLQARQMVAQGYFAHVGPDGRQLRTRLADARWIPRVGTWSAGEILAEGTGVLGTPASLVDAWLHSPEHLSILQDPTFDRIGVGIAPGTPVNGPDGMTVAVEFGRRSL